MMVEMVKHKVNVFIRSDRSTVDALKIVAGEKPIAQYLRDIVAGNPPPASRIETQLENILKKLNEFDRYLSNAEANIAMLSDMLGVYDKALRSDPKMAKLLDKEISEYWRRRGEEE